MVAMLAAVFFVGQAEASTFCVPDFSSTCPASGGNLAQADLNQALSLSGSDGIPDKVMIAPGTFTAASSFKAPGNDPLEVVGSGRDQTFLTSSATTNTYVLDLFGGSNREVTVRNLAVVVPVSFPNVGGNGSALVESGDQFESVDLITRNDGATAVVGPDGSTSFRDVRVFGANGARFSTAFYGGASKCGTEDLVFDRVEIDGAGTGLVWRCPDARAMLNRVSFTGVNNALNVNNGGRVVVENALIGSGEGPPIAVNTTTNDVTSLALNHVTLVATGDASQPAIRARVDNLSAPTKDIEINISNSIISGFAKPWELEAPFGSTKGNIVMSVAHTATDSVGSLTGEVAINSSENLFGTPTFAGPTDFRLAGGSLGIDAADPAATAPLIDLAGSSRPVDGDGDGTAVSDLGAFEFQPPDVAAPQVTKVRFTSKIRRASILAFSLSEAATVSMVFKPVPKSKGRKQVRVVRSAAAGRLTVKLPRKRLKAGRYRLTVLATDLAGNKSSPLVRKVRVKR